tara:strand:- start:9359 stop:9952 length:594 start_codon:yes stop_codon:yes gene_type:complete
LLIDNGSDTNQISEFSDKLTSKMNWELIRSDKNLGFGGGVKFGAEKADCEYVAWMPGNLKLNPIDVYNFFQNNKIQDDKVLLKAYRTGRPFLDRLKTIVFGIVVSPFFRVNMMDSGGTPNLVHKSFFNLSKAIPNDFSFDVFVLYYFRLNKLPIYRPKITYQKRMYGSSHWQKGIISEVNLTLQVIKSRNIWKSNSE